MRLLAVWPVLIGLSLFIFSPWIEAWWRLPPAGTALPQRVADQGYGRLIALADGLDWSMLPDEPLSRMPPEVLRLFGEANRETLLELPKILDQPCRPPLDSLRIASQLSQRESDSFESIVQALYLLEQGAVATHDVPTQYVVAHIALLLARPLRRESLYSHYALGCWIELQGFAMIDRGRQAFDVEQCRALMASVRESAVLEEPCDSVLARDDEWLMDVFGWRTRIERACNSWVGSPAAYVRGIELEHEGFRRTLLCDLALRQYECEHQLASPSRLDDLVPRYLSEVPRDPFGTGPLQYESSRAILPFPYAFSLGPNQRSEGGEVSGFMREGDDLAIARYSRDAACDELLISSPPRARDPLRRPPATTNGLE